MSFCSLCLSPASREEVHLLSTALSSSPAKPGPGGPTEEAGGVCEGCRCHQTDEYRQQAESGPSQDPAPPASSEFHTSQPRDLRAPPGTCPTTACASVPFQFAHPHLFSTPSGSCTQSLAQQWHRKPERNFTCCLGCEQFEQSHEKQICTMMSHSL